MCARFQLNGVVLDRDVAKAARNQHEHRVTQEHGSEGFFDPFLRIVEADRGGEPRDALIGYDAQGRLLFVVHVIVGDESIRIVSARKATSRERQAYDS